MNSKKRIKGKGMKSAKSLVRSASTKQLYQVVLQVTSLTREGLLKVSLHEVFLQKSEELFIVIISSSCI